MSLAAGARLDGYQIIGLLGAGGMGEVYRALDTRLGREVALKILPPSMAGDPAAYGRFEREAQAVAALSHPNILAVHDVGRTDVATYAVFELLEGASLRDRLAQGPLPVRKAIDYARQVADGLAAAHARGITHRDIKPDNLFLTEDGRVKILDFGLAQAAPPAGAGETVTGATAAPTITAAGTVLGTVGYMAPEQVRGQTLDHRADLFALGATLYEMCAGRRAFKGETAADTLAAVLSSDPPELSLSGQTVPPALERIIRRCLEKERTERFQSARDLSFALDALSTLSGSGSIAPEPARRSRGWWPIAATAIAALGLGVVGGRAWPSRTPDAPPAPSLRAEIAMATGRGSSRIRLFPDGRFMLTSELPPGASRTNADRHAHAGDGRVGCRAGVTRRDDRDVVAAERRISDLCCNQRRIATRAAPGSDVHARRLAGGRVARGGVVVGRHGRLRDGRFALHQRACRHEGVKPSPVRGGGPDDPPISALMRIGARTDAVLALATPGGAGRQLVRIDLASGALTADRRLGLRAGAVPGVPAPPSTQRPVCRPLQSRSTRDCG